MVLSPSDNCCCVEKLCIFLAMLEPFYPRLLIPVEFFSIENSIIFINEIVFQSLEVLVGGITEGFLDTINTSHKGPFLLVDITKTLLV